MRKAVSSFTTQKRKSRCLLSYLSIRRQFVNPQWAACGRIWKNKILGVPRLPNEFEFEVVFKYRLATELPCVHRVYPGSGVCWKQNLNESKLSLIISMQMAKSQTKSSFHFTASPSSQTWDEFHVMWAGQHVQKKLVKERLILIQNMCLAVWVSP